MHYLKSTLAVGLATTLLLAGCAGTPVDAPAGPAANPETLAAAPGYDPETKTITVGALFPLSGFFANTTQDVVAMRAYFQRATSAGGLLDGYTIEVLAPDTQYKPDVAIPLYQGLKDKVALFAGILGSGVTNALLPSMKVDGTVGVAMTDKSYLTEANIVPTFPSWQIQMANIIAYEAENGHRDSRFCTLMQDDLFGETTNIGAQHAIDELGLDFGEGVRYPFGNTDFTAQVSTLKDAGCEVIGVGGTGTVLQGIAVRAAQLNFDASWVAIGASYSQDIAVGSGADYIKEHMKLAFTGTDWLSDDVEGQTMLREDVAAIAPDAIPAAITYQLGYVYAMAATAVLAQAVEDNDLSRANILSIASGGLVVDNHGLGGGDFDYGDKPEDRNPPRGTSIFKVDPSDPTGLVSIGSNFTSGPGTSINVQG
jgi:ABC-type branched-subunit amino acid transport system substrate-binding protein